MKIHHIRFAQLATTVLAALAFSVCIAAPTSAAEFVSVKKDGVNIRSGPSTNQEILWEVFKDYPLKVVKRQAKWAMVSDFEGDQGWIYSPLLSQQKTVIVQVKTANMRVGPGKNYEIKATVKYGVVFKPLSQEGDWVNVVHEDGTNGWIYRNLLWPSN